MGARYQLIQLDVNEQISVDKAKVEILTLLQPDPTPLILVNNAGVTFVRPAVE